MIRKFMGVVLLTLAATLLTSAQDAPAPAAKGRVSKPKRVPATPAASKEFSDDVATQVLGLVRDGLQSHSSARFLAAFDREGLPDYLAFEDQVHSFFNQYDSFRAYFRLLQISKDDSRGLVLAEWQIESTRDSSGPPQRRQSQVRFELAPGKSGWQIVALSPRNFFQ